MINEKNLNGDESFKKDFLSLYKENDFFQTFVDTTWVDKYENMMFKTYFPVDNIPSEVSATTGTSMYAISSQVKRGATNAMARAKGSELPSKDVQGQDIRTGSFQDYGDGWHMTGLQKQAYDKLAKELGSDSPLFKQYVIETDSIIRSHYQLLNEMSVQKMSTGRFTNSAYLGLSKDLPVTTPYELDSYSRDVACGDKVWTDPTATIVTDIRNRVQDFRDTTGYEGTLSLKMERDFFLNVFLKNNELKELVTNYMQAGGAILPTGALLTEKNYNQWNVDMGGYIPPIEFVEQQSLILGSTETFKVNGWKSGIVVLSPSGAQGVTKWSISDEYDTLNGFTDIAIAKLDGGLLSSMNRIRIDNGRLPSYNTEVIGSYEPILATWNNHWCINSNKASV